MTAKEFLISKRLNGWANHTIVSELMSEFAKYQVELALKEASEKVNYHYLYEYECEDHTPYWGACGNCGSYSNNKVLVGVEIDKDSILNAYDLNNIK